MSLQKGDSIRQPCSYHCDHMIRDLSRSSQTSSSYTSGTSLNKSEKSYKNTRVFSLNCYIFMGVFLILGVLQLLPQPPFIFYFIIIFKKKKDYYLQSHCFGKKLA